MAAFDETVATLHCCYNSVVNSTIGYMQCVNKKYMKHAKTLNNTDSGTGALGWSLYCPSLSCGTAICNTTGTSACVKIITAASGSFNPKTSLVGCYGTQCICTGMTYCICYLCCNCTVCCTMTNTTYLNFAAGCLASSVNSPFSSVATFCFNLPNNTCLSEVSIRSELLANCTCLSCCYCNENNYNKTFRTTMVVEPTWTSLNSYRKWNGIC